MIDQNPQFAESPTPPNEVPVVADDSALPADHPARKHIGKETNPFDGVVSRVRRMTPAAIVNSGTQINLGLKASADVMSLWSSVRKGSQSPNRLVASVVTLVTEVLGIFYKEKAVSDDQKRDYETMGAGRYAVTKTLEAFNPKDHILETNGLATIINGAFTTFSGMHQSVKTRISWEILQGVLTTAAGFFMVYMPDRERAWQVSHTIFMTRIPAAGKQAWNAWKVGVPEKNIAKGDWQQGAKLLLNQLSNFFAICYGGVKKLDDGSIVALGKDSTDDVPEKMKQRPHAKNIDHQHSIHEKPSATISSGTTVSRVTDMAQEQMVGVNG